MNSFETIKINSYFCSFIQQYLLNTYVLNARSCVKYNIALQQDILCQHTIYQKIFLPLCTLDWYRRVFKWKTQLNGFMNNLKLLQGITLLFQMFSPLLMSFVHDT